MKRRHPILVKKDIAHRRHHRDGQIGRQRCWCGKGKSILESNFTVEILAATFGLEMQHATLRNGMMGLMVVVTETMPTLFRGIAEAARDLMVLQAIVEVDVQVERHKQHIERHQQRSDLQQSSIFHDAKIRFLSFVKKGTELFGIFAVWK